MLSPGQKVIVKKTGESGVVLNSIADTYLLEVETKDGLLTLRGYWDISEIHPLKFGVGEEVVIPLANNLQGAVSKIEWNDMLKEPVYHINEHVIFEGTLKLLNAFSKQIELEKVERRNEEEDELTLEDQALMKRALDDPILKRVRTFLSEACKELTDKYFKEKEEMQKFKFEIGDKIKTIAESEHDKIGETGIILYREIARDANNAEKTYLVKFDTGELGLWFESELEKIEKPKFKYPDLVVGKKYNLENGSSNPHEFVGYMKASYHFKRVGAFASMVVGNDEQIGEITEYVEPTLKLEVGKKYIIPGYFIIFTFTRQFGEQYEFVTPGGAICLFDKVELKDIKEHKEPDIKAAVTFTIGRKYYLPNLRPKDNPIKLTYTIGNCFCFEDKNGFRMSFHRENLKEIQEYKEPYSKEFWVCYADDIEPTNDLLDQLTGLYCSNVIYQSHKEAKNGLEGCLTNIKQFRITEVL